MRNSLHRYGTSSLRSFSADALTLVSMAIRIDGFPAISVLTFPGCDADRLVGALQPDIALSTNAACSAGILQPSHVLLALGLSESDAASTIRVGFGRFNTRAEVEVAAERVAAVVTRIREGVSLEIAAV